MQIINQDIKNMDKTIKFIDKYIKDNKLKYNTTMCATGFIYYKNIHKNKNNYFKLCDNIYNSCINLK